MLSFASVPTPDGTISACLAARPPSARAARTATPPACCWRSRSDSRDEAYMRRHHHRGPVDLVFHGDTGCYTMLMFEPNTALMHNYSRHGPGRRHRQRASTRSSPTSRSCSWATRPSSTPAPIAITNAIAGRPGHHLHHPRQRHHRHDRPPAHARPGRRPPRPPHPRPGHRADRPRGHRRQRVLVLRVNPADRDDYKRMLEETILADGVKIIIADKECGITYHRRRTRARTRGATPPRLPPRKVHMNITPEVCENCLRMHQPHRLPRPDHRADRLRPQDRHRPLLVRQRRRLRPHRRLPLVRAGDRHPQAPAASARTQDGARRHPRAGGSVQRPRLAVPGSPASAAWASAPRPASSSAPAPRRLPRPLLRQERPGHPQRRRLFPAHPQPRPRVPGHTIPYGKADLLLGIDPLEAVRAVDANQSFRVATPQRTAAVINTDRTPTIRTLMGLDDFRVEELEAMLRKATRPDCYFSATSPRCASASSAPSSTPTSPCWASPTSAGSSPCRWRASRTASAIPSVPISRRTCGPSTSAASW